MSNALAMLISKLMGGSVKSVLVQYVRNVNWGVIRASVRNKILQACINMLWAKVICVAVQIVKQELKSPVGATI